MSYKEEDKELLLKDLCSRLPYGVMVREDTVLYDDKNTTSHRVRKLSYVHIGKCFSRIKGFVHDYEYIYIPYLFPLSSMTEEQEKEYDRIIELEIKAINDEINHTQVTAFEVDFYHKHHLDWQGLIPKGLAIDCTNLNIY